MWNNAFLHSEIRCVPALLHWTENTFEKVLSRNVPMIIQLDKLFFNRN